MQATNVFFVVFLGAGVEETVRKRKTLNDQQKYAANMALHALCMSKGGKFKRNDKKVIEIFSRQMSGVYKEFGKRQWSKLHKVWRWMFQIREKEDVEERLKTSIWSKSLQSHSIRGLPSGH